MTREQLEHAIRAACDVSEDTEIWIFGSQAILGEFPNAPAELRAHFIHRANDCCKLPDRTDQLTESR